MGKSTLAKKITEEELQTFFDAIPRVTKRSTYWLTLFMTLSDAGLRAGEAVRLKINDIHQEKNIITVHQQKNGVDHEDTPFTQRLREQLNKFIALYHKQIKESGDYMFFTQYTVRGQDVIGEGEHIKTSNLRKMFNKVRAEAATVMPSIGRAYTKRTTKDVTNGNAPCKALGRPLMVITPHTLRHRFIQRIADQEGLFKAQQCARHLHFSSTLVYAKKSMKAKVEAINNTFDSEKKDQAEEINELKEQVASLTKMLQDNMNILKFIKGVNGGNE